MGTSVLVGQIGVSGYTFLFLKRLNFKVLEVFFEGEREKFPRTGKNFEKFISKNNRTQKIFELPLIFGFGPENFF